MTKIVRTFDMVETSKLEELLNLCKNHHMSEATMMAGIGYKQSGTTLAEARRVGLVKRSIYMAVKGYVADNIREDKTAEVLTICFEEAELLFMALRKARDVYPRRVEEIKSLQAKVAVHMSKL